jgi:hypothetical protein
MRRVFVRDTATSRIAAVEALPSTPATAVEVAAAGFGVALDPSDTAAYATIGVCVDNPTASPVVLRPGEFLYVPRGFKKLYLFNTLGWLIARCKAENRPAGRLTLLVTETASDAVKFTDRGFTGARGGGQVNAGEVAATVVPIHNGLDLGWNGQLTPHIPLTGVRKMRVAVFPAGLAGSLGATVVPADFAATLRPWVLLAMKSDTDKVALQPAPFGGWQSQPWADIAAEPGLVTWLPHSAGDIQATGTDCVFEFDVPSGLMLAFQLLAVAGTGVSKVWVGAEVY